MLKDPEVKGRETEVIIIIPKKTKEMATNNKGISRSFKPKDLWFFPISILCKID